MSENDQSPDEGLDAESGEGVPAPADTDAGGEVLPDDARQGEAVESEAVPDFAPATYEEVDQDADPPSAVQEDVNLDVILDIPVTLSLEIGRTRISIRNLLQLNQGSVVELDRLAGDSMDVLVNGTLIAHGEVVVVNDKFGVRLTDVISPAERVRRLK